MSIVIDQTHHAKLLLALNEIARDMGIDEESSDYFNGLEKLTDETIEKLVKVWVQS